MSLSPARDKIWQDLLDTWRESRPWLRSTRMPWIAHYYCSATTSF